MTNQEIIDKFESDKAKASLGIAGGVFVQTDLVHEIVKALRSQPCEDAISRQAAIDGINRYFHDEYYQRTSIQDCRDCLIEDVIKDLPPVISKPKTGYCKNCKWWKDSDGLYRRGCHAESQCPINRREVFEGNGYCYMIEPQESE